MDMKGSSKRGAAFFVSTLLFVLFAALLVLRDINPPSKLLTLDGSIVGRTPIHTKGKLTGFRFCLGNPLVTFTYQDPDPRVESVWAVMENSKRAVVLYSTHSGRNPTLWGLQADDRTLATVAELESARTKQWLIWLAGALISGAVAVAVACQKLKSRLRHHDT